MKSRIEYWGMYGAQARLLWVYRSVHTDGGGHIEHPNPAAGTWSIDPKRFSRLREMGIDGQTCSLDDNAALRFLEDAKQRGIGPDGVVIPKPTIAWWLIVVSAAVCVLASLIVLVTLSPDTPGPVPAPHRVVLSVVMPCMLAVIPAGLWFWRHRSCRPVPYVQPPRPVHEPKCCARPQMKAVKTIESSNHGCRSVSRCESCGQYWFYRFSEYVSFVGPDELTTWWTPMTAEEAESVLVQPE